MEIGDMDKQYHRILMPGFNCVSLTAFEAKKLLTLKINIKQQSLHFIAFNFLWEYIGSALATVT